MEAMSSTPRPRVGRVITPEQFDGMSDEELERIVPKAIREYFPGKDACADGFFYLHDGTAWCFVHSSRSASSLARVSPSSAPDSTSTAARRVSALSEVRSA